jgi:uncharacterized iron-regulated membrane protein
MSFWRQWAERPQQVWVRRALFQIHLWSGIALGLYVLVSSVTGSAIVFRNEIYNKYSKSAPTVPVTGERLRKQQIEEAARRANPGYAVTFQSQPRDRALAVEVWLERNGKKRQRLFNPYTAEDLGDAISPAILWTAWLGDLHINLLAGPTGRIVNGWGAVVLTIMCITGAIVWWPGVSSWRRNLKVSTSASWKRFNWDLHSAVGFWTFALVFMWAVTGIYVVFPEQFQRAVNRFYPLDYYRIIDEVPQPLLQKGVQIVNVADQAPPPTPRRRRPPPHRSTGDKILGAFYAAHFGNFGGAMVKTIWTILGLVPAMLFVTGVIMWWNRVVSPKLKPIFAVGSSSTAQAAPQSLHS